MLNLFQHRLYELKKCAEEDSVNINKQSEKLLWQFIHTLDFITPQLSLSPDGIYYASWESRGNKFSVHFKEENQIVCVWFNGDKRMQFITDIDGGQLLFMLWFIFNKP